MYKWECCWKKRCLEERFWKN